MNGARRSGGFTLIEILVVSLLTAIVLSFSVNFYLQLSRATQEAAALTEEGRRAVAILDRIARDLEGAFLVKKPEAVDPLAHPWVFLGESGVTGGADRIKWQTRNHRPRADAANESDLAVVSYWASRADDDGLVLHRFSTPHLPEGLDRSFPTDNAAGVQAFARDVAEFGIRFLDEEGNWVDEWDSSTLARTGQLPRAAEIRVALVAPDEGSLLGPEPSQPFSRRVWLPLRPLDLEEALEGDGEGDEDGDEEEDAECVTVAECRAQNAQVFEGFLASLPAGERASLEDVFDSIADQCFADHADSLPPGVEGCE